MAGKRKAEGIALLAAYGGEDDDAASQTSSDEDDKASEIQDVDSQAVKRLASDHDAAAGPTATHRSAVPGRAGSFGIVDYAQDEGLAVSPENEQDGEVLGTEGTAGEENEEQPENGVIRENSSRNPTPSPGKLSSLQPDSTAEGSALDHTERENTEGQPSGPAEGQEGPAPDDMEVDVLNEFLPPVPPVPYSGELQAKFSRYLALKRTGISLNEQLRNTKGYRNPDFLQSAVRHYDIDHIGSCFKKEIFDPHGFDQSDYHDSIAQEIQREAERKQQERRQNQRIDFVRTSIQSAVAVGKPLVPMLQKVVTVSSSEISVRTEGRSSKKSKWDKVEVEGGRPAQAILNAADAIAAANAQAAFLSAGANASASYMPLVQRRKEVSSSSILKIERKTDRS